MKTIAAVAVAIVVAVAAGAFAQGTKKTRPLPFQYGTVTINNFSAAAAMAPVSFDHWVHRSKFTCRLCHVDVGFAMKAGGSQIRASDNMKGYFCGTCHNGRSTYDGKKIFEACSRDYSREDAKRCRRCHVLFKDDAKENAFDDLSAQLPHERFGNGIDWEKAEEKGLIKPIDYIEGLSVRRGNLAVQKDFALNAKIEGMPDILFSHRKHTVWNGCETCHPDIFIGVKKGTTRYTMVEIFDGKYCGACHGSVAFPLTDCQRCHTKPVQQG